MAAKIGWLNVDLRLESARFTKGLGDAQKRARESEKGFAALSGKVGALGKSFIGLGAVFAGGALVGGLTSLVAKGLEHASALGEQAQQLGVSTKALQEYRYAASQSGIASGEMDKALQKLTLRAGQAAAGAKGPAEAFAKLGIDIKAFVASGKDSGDLLPLIADGLAKMGSPAERSAVGFQALGKAFQVLEPLLAGGSKGINNLRDAAQSLGIVLSDEDIKNADEAADKLSEVKTVLEAQLAKTVAANAKEITELATALGNLASKAIQLAGDWLRMRRALDTQQGKYRAADAYLAGRRDLTPEVRERARVIVREKIDDKLGIDSNTTSYLGGLFKLREVKPKKKTNSTKFIDDGFDLGGNLPNVLAGTPGRGTAGVAQLLGGMADGVAAQMQRLDKVVTATATKAATEAAKKAEEELTERAERLRGLLDRLFPEQRARLDYAADRAVIDQARGRGELTAGQAGEANLRLFVEGPDSPLAKLGRGFEKFSAGHEAATATAERLNLRIGQSFADMADETLARLNGLAGAIKGGGFLNILSSVVGLGLQLGGIGAFGKTIAGNLAKSLPSGGVRIPGYALGTKFHPGGLAMVGERGPELVRMSRGAQVIPNHELGGFGGRGVSRIEVIPSPYFNVVVDNRIVGASGPIMAGGAHLAWQRSARAQSRRLA